MVPFLTPEYRNISQESGFTLLGVGVNMFLKLPVATEKLAVRTMELMVPAYSKY